MAGARRHRTALAIAWLQIALAAGVVQAQDPLAAFQAAETAYANRDYPAAVDGFRAYLKAHPRDRNAPLAAYRIGECLAGLEQFEEAALAFGDCARRYPDSNVAENATYNEGHYFYRAEAWRKAADAFLRYAQAGANPSLQARAWFWRGEALYRDAQFAPAQAAYEALLALPAETLADEQVAALLPYARHSIARSLYAQGEFAAAATAFGHVIERWPANPLIPDALYYGGESLRQAGQLDQALGWLNRVVADHPKSEFAPKALQAIAQTELARGNTEAAAAAMKRLYADHGGSEATADPANRFALADQLFRGQDYAAAAELYTAGLAGAPAEAVPLARLQLARCHEELGQHDRALAGLRELLAADPPDDLAAAGQMRLGIVALKADDPAAAEQAFLAFLAAWPEHDDAVLARYNLGIALFRQDKAAAALDAFRQVAAANPADDLAARAMLELGRHLAEAGDHTTARQAFDAYLAHYLDQPEAVHAWWGGAQAAEAAGDLPSAIRAYRTLVDKHGTDVLAERALARLVAIYRQQGDTARADAAATELQDKFPQSEAAGGLLLTEGMEAYKAQRYDDAVTALQTLLERFPRHESAAVAIDYLAASYYLASGLTDNFRLAAEAYDRLAREHPESDGAKLAWFWAGRAYQQADEPQRAVECFQQFITAQPESEYVPQARLHLASALSATGQHAEAITMLRAAAEAAKTPEARFEARWRLAEALLAAGQDDAGYAELEVIARQSTDADQVARAEFRLALRAYERKEYTLAAGRYESWLKKHREHALEAAARHNLGLALMELDRHAEAATSFERAVALLAEGHPLRAEAGYYGGLSLFYAADYDGALAALASFERTNPEHPLAGDSVYYRGRVLGAASRWAEAETAFNTFLQQFPEHTLAAAARFNLGAALQQQDKLAAAITTYTELAESLPAEDEVAANALLRLAQCHYQQKQHRPALAAFDRAEASGVAAVQPEAMYYAGLCLLELGEKERAAAKLDALIRQHPVGPWTDKAKALRGP